MTTSLEVIDQLIAAVEAMPAAAGGSGFTGNFIDVCWRPEVAIGHTAYSWLGEGQEGGPPGGPAVLAAASSGEVKRQQKAAAKAPAEPAQEQKREAKTKEKKAPAPKAGAAAAAGGPDFGRLEIKVGKVLKAWKHPDAQKLYLEEIDLGEGQPRQIASGLFGFISLEDFTGSEVLVCTNLKPVDMRGHMSNGMVLAASDAAHTKVELVRPPKGSKVGERVNLEGLDISKQAPEKDVNGKKDNSAWAVVKAKLRSDGAGIATWDGRALTTSAGKCTVPSLKDCQIA